MPQCGWGCTIGPSDATFGAGFSSISTDHWRSLTTDPDPVQGYVHEWLPFGLYEIEANADLMLSSYASLEAQAAAVADDIAYNAHDIDDALRAGLIAIVEFLR